MKSTFRFCHLTAFGLLLLAHLAPAQDLTNAGTTLSLAGGATLFVPGTLTNTAPGSVLDLSSGPNTLRVAGSLLNGGPGTLAAGPASSVVLPGSAPQVLDLNGATLANLTIDNAAGVAVPTNGTLTGTLTLSSGLLTTAPTATLTLANGAGLVGEQNGRYVAGNLAAVRASVSGATAFPNGISLTPAAPLSNLTLTRTAGLNTAQLSYGTNAGGSVRGIDQLWQASAPLTNAQITLTWLSDNDNGLTSSLGSSQPWARAAAPVAGTSWTAVGPPQNAASTRTVTAAVPAGQSWSFFTVSTAAAPLPVTLVAFTAERQGDEALLRWTTASELNNDRFEVEVSADGQGFRKIGQVAGQGTYATAHRYQLADPRLLSYAANPVYYRLRQVDRDGTATFSPVRTVRIEGLLPFAVAAFPNPVPTTGTQLRVRTAQAGPLQLLGYDATGRLVLHESATLQPGTTDLDLLRAGQLPTGVYYLKATQGGQTAGLKLLRP